MPTPFSMLRPAGLLAASLACSMAASPLESARLVLPATPQGPLEIHAQDRPMLQSPPEGLWSVALGWQEGWPADWHHAHATEITRSGDWHILTGRIELPQGTLLLRDAYRQDRHWVHLVRRWTWTGERPLERCTLSLRWHAPDTGPEARAILPGVVLYGNPAGHRAGAGAVIHHQGDKPGETTFVEEHRPAAPWVCVEWTSGKQTSAAALHTLPSPASGGNRADQWWSIGMLNGEDFTELAALSGPTAANGRKSIVKSLQNGFHESPDTWITLAPGSTVEKHAWLELVPETTPGNGFRQPLHSALRLHPALSTHGLPETRAIVRDKQRHALSRFRNSPADPGFEMYPPEWQRRKYVMGWAGQAEAGAHTLLALAARENQPEAVRHAARALDFLSTSPFNEQGFHVIHDYGTATWSGQDPVSQGQAMETFARAIRTARKLDGVDPTAWESFLHRACKLHANRILAPDWSPVNTAEAFFVSPLCRAAALFGEPQFLQAALKAGETYAKRHLDMREPYWGGTLDARCEDKEGAWAAFQAFLALHESTGSPTHLEWASHAMDVVLSYTVLWDIDLPPGRLRDHGLKTRGWTIVSAQNQHLDVYGVLYTPEIWRMGTLLQRPELHQLAAVMFRSCGQLSDPFGSTGEQIQQTQFAQRGDLTDLTRMRGGYSEDWTVFWISAHFLTAAAEFLHMGVDLDQSPLADP
jgi:hypothetical protein